MRKTIVINLFGGPGAGKSTVAAGLFYNLKKEGINCEMALEFAKDKVYEESFHTMDDQIYILGKQYHKIFRLVDKVDVIITDSPLFLSILYNKEQSAYFDFFALEIFNRFNNLNFFIERTGEYKPEGRMQTQEEALELDDDLLSLLDELNVPFKSIPNNEAVEMITGELLKLLK